MEYYNEKMSCKDCGGDAFELYVVHVSDYGDMPPFEFPNYKCKSCGRWVTRDTKNDVGLAVALMFAQKYDIQQLLDGEEEE